MINRRTVTAGLASLPLTLASRLHAETADPLKIGLIAPLSGAGASWGRGMLGGISMAAEDWNQKGGLPVGTQQRQIAITAYDDKYSGPQAAQAAQRLINQDGIDIIFGPLGSVSVLAVAEITESAKALVLCNSFTTKALSPSKPFTFRVITTSNEFAGPFIAWMAKKLPNLKTVALITPNDDTGKEVAAAANAGYAKAGVKVQAQEFYERGTQDFVPVLTRLLAGNPDVLDLDASPPVDAGVLVKQARQFGFKGPIVQVGGNGVPDILRIAGAAAEGFYYYSWVDSGDAKVAALNNRYEKANKAALNPIGVIFYDAARMAFAAISAAGSAAPDAVRGQLDLRKDYEGVNGRYVWTGRNTYGIDHQWNAPFVIGQIVNGHETVVERIAV